MTARARSLSPDRSSRPITGRASQTIATERLSTNALPNASMTSRTGLPAATPVVTAAATTTSSGLSRRANPATTIRMPRRGSRPLPVGLRALRPGSADDVLHLGHERRHVVGDAVLDRPLDATAVHRLAVLDLVDAGRVEDFQVLLLIFLFDHEGGAGTP